MNMTCLSCRCTRLHKLEGLKAWDKGALLDNSTEFVSFEVRTVLLHADVRTHRHVVCQFARQQSEGHVSFRCAGRCRERWRWQRRQWRRFRRRRLRSPPVSDTRLTVHLSDAFMAVHHLQGVGPDLEMSIERNGMCTGSHFQKILCSNGIIGRHACTFEAQGGLQDCKDL